MGLPKRTLYKICLERVYGLVKEGVWNSCSINPFLNFPSGIIDDLMAHTEYGNTKISEIFLLLTSGSLTRLHLGGFKLKEENDLFQEVTRRNCFKSLRFLGWSFGEKRSIPLIEALIRSSPKLEEFHSSNIVNLDAFQNCKDLRVLVFSTSLEDPVLNLSLLSSLKNLEVFFSFSTDSNIIADILMYCPQLISLGRIDSLDGLSKIFARKGETCYPKMPDQFQLKRCLWGRRTERFKLMTSLEVCLYKTNFPDRISTAVSLCPFVGELTIYVNHTNSIESLKNLKHLVYLEISFRECDGEYMADFLELLKIIGPNLKHLSIDGRYPVPVDATCGFCPYLQTLELKRSATVNGPVQLCDNVFLKNLRIMQIDQNALQFLLSNCKALVELSICNALCLDDNLLSQILRVNPLKDLKISDITESTLTKIGFRMFLEKAVSLERVHFAPFRRDVAYEIKNIIHELNLTNVTYGEIDDISCDEFRCILPKYCYESQTTTWGHF